MVQFRRFLKYATAFIVVAQLTWIIVDIFQCSPVDAFWNTLDGELSKELGDHCINSRLYYMLSGAVNTIEDFILLVLVRETNNAAHLNRPPADDIPISPYRWCGASKQVKIRSSY